jgi:hypothetical protein
MTLSLARMSSPENSGNYCGARIMLRIFMFLVLNLGATNFVSIERVWSASDKGTSNADADHQLMYKWESHCSDLETMDMWTADAGLVLSGMSEGMRLEDPQDWSTWKKVRTELIEVEGAVREIVVKRAKIIKGICPNPKINIIKKKDKSYCIDMRMIEMWIADVRENLQDVKDRMLFENPSVQPRNPRDWSMWKKLRTQLVVVEGMLYDIALKVSGRDFVNCRIENWYE